MRLRAVLRVLLPLLVVSIGALGMMLLISLRPEPEVVPPVEVVPRVESVAAEVGPAPVTVVTHGTVAPRTESQLRAEVAGRITWISGSLVNGGFFDHGEPLLEIDDTDYRLALEEAELAVAQAELVLVREQADADVARREWERLGREGEPSPLTLREPQVAEARAALEAAQARVERALRDVQRCRVVAPYDGRVRLETVDVGEYLMPGSEIAAVYAVDAAEIRLPLADVELAFLDLPLAYRGSSPSDGAGTQGPSVTLHAEFGGAEYAWQGHVVRTEGEIDANRMVVAVASVGDPYGRTVDDDRPPLAVGLFVEAHIRGRVLQDAITLPRSALRGRDGLWVVRDGRLEMRTVKVLRADARQVVVGSGLQPGERVIVSPLEAVVDGMRVADAMGED